jgi:hypothetical protein
MSKLSTIRLILWVSLSIFFSGVNAFAQADRREYFKVAFESLPELIEYAIADPQFLSELNANEKTDLAKILSVMENRQYNNTPNLEFSENRDLFKLDPQQPERAAVTNEDIKGPIFINLLQLNSSSFKAKYIDVIQILIHELAHKMGKREQADVDSLVAKIIRFAKPFLQEFETGHLRLEILSLPRKVSHLAFKIRPPVKILVSYKDQIESLDLSLEQRAKLMGRFTPSEQGSGQIEELHWIRASKIEADPVGERDLSGRLKIEIESVSQLILGDPRLALRPGPVNAEGQQVMIPSQRFFPLLKETRITTNLVSQFGIPEVGRNSNQLFFFNQVTPWEPRDLSAQIEAKVVAENKNEFTVQLHPAQPGKTIQARVQMAEGEILISGKSNASGLIQFQWPTDVTSADGKLKIRDLILNSQDLVGLNKVLSREVPVSPAGTKPKISSEPELLTDKGWEKFQQIERIIDLPEGPEKIRLKVKLSAPLGQVRAQWIFGQQLFWEKPSQVFGTYTDVVDEVLNFKILKTEGEFTWIEIESQLLKKSIALETLQPFVGVTDHGRRNIKSIKLTDANGRTSTVFFHQDVKMYTREFLRVKQPLTGGACAKAHH